MTEIAYDETLITRVNKMLPKGLRALYTFRHGSDRKILTVRYDDTGKSILDVGKVYVDALGQMFFVFLELMIRGATAEAHCEDCDRVCGFKSQKHWMNKE